MKMTSTFPLPRTRVTRALAKWMDGWMDVLLKHSSLLCGMDKMLLSYLILAYFTLVK